GLGMFQPVATLNGHRVPLQWGQTVVPAPPGVHAVRIHIPYLWDMGAAQITVDTRNGAPAEIFYAPPWGAFMRGAIGRQPVKSPGLGLMLGLLIGITAFAVLCTVAAAMLPS
ncbi:MAG TPA: hypothetical protein VGR21_14075, partial [Cryptosporangiaceae bacterium]|nr:hypothetical protein [Cryptosporangiaceae bacterium]